MIQVRRHQGAAIKHHACHRAFSLVELMLVVIIIGILAVMVVPRLTGRTETAREGVARTDIDLTIATALKLYDLDNGGYPATEEGLEALLAAPPGARNWKGPYLDVKLEDPWGRKYLYRCPGIHQPGKYDLSSLGRDGVESSDDIVNWEEDGR